MPITILPTNNRPNQLYRDVVKTPKELFEESCRQDAKKSTGILQSSFTNLEAEHISPSSNGFVHAACDAYSQHHHLKIRPEDVWFSILAQLSFYINNHAEELRSVYVAHEGKKPIVVSAFGTMEGADFGRLALELTEQLDEHLNDPSLRNWIMPDFTTTETTDKVVAAITMMGTLQAYFSYGVSFCCGLPSVTLLGEREDWVKLRARLEKIPSWDKEGPRKGRGVSELKTFVDRLETVLDFFIRSFDDPQGSEVIAFWNKIVRKRSLGSGGSYMSGWLTAFCFWSEKGDRIVEEWDYDPNDCTIGGTRFQTIETADIPRGYTSVPVLVNDNGEIHKTKMLAGSVGHRVTSSGDLLDQPYSSWDSWDRPEPKAGLDSIQPVVGWWMYEYEDSSTD
ncbi:unnamed protein product [Clonostachys rosea]|uniref:DUF4419 domain-containing protein n=1 Tax=Bionectria ochroleuca TaxID=29856 RepID=A0ABY6UXM6_BIOOC|nr:unnamed protein product [Clonostachys rosea]